MRNGLRVAERAQPVVVLLPRRVPQPQVDRLAVHHHVGGVVVEDGRDIVLWRCGLGLGFELGLGLGFGLGFGFGFGLSPVTALMVVRLGVAVGRGRGYGESVGE